MKITTYQPMPPSALAIKIVLTDQEVRQAIFEYLARNGIETAGGKRALFIRSVADDAFEVQLDAGARINTICPTE